MSEYIKKRKISNEIEEPIYTCNTEHSEYPTSAFAMDPAFVAELDPTAPTASYTAGVCF